MVVSTKGGECIGVNREVAGYHMYNSTCFAEFTPTNEFGGRVDAIWKGLGHPMCLITASANSLHFSSFAVVSPSADMSRWKS